MSGINPGLNTGRATLHSGTVGAALTAANLGLSGLAVSQDYGDPMRWPTAAALGVEAIGWLDDAPDRTVLNLNVPNTAPDEVKGIRWATLAPFGSVRAAIADADDGRLQMEFREVDDELPDGLRHRAGLRRLRRRVVAGRDPRRRTAARGRRGRSPDPPERLAVLGGFLFGLVIGLGLAGLVALRLVPPIGRERGPAPPSGQCHPVGAGRWRSSGPDASKGPWTWWARASSSPTCTGDGCSPTPPPDCSPTPATRRRWSPPRSTERWLRGSRDGPSSRASSSSARPPGR